MPDIRINTIDFTDQHTIKRLIWDKNPQPFIISSLPDEYITQFSDQKLLALLANSECLVKDAVMKKQVRMKFSDYFELAKLQFKNNNVNKRYTLQMGNIISQGMFIREKKPPFSRLLPYIENILFDVIRHKLLEANLWIDSGNNITRLHFDPVDNFLMLLEGEKEVTLISNQDSQYVYLSKKSPLHSEVDILNIDTEKYPLFGKANAINVKLSAGEVLFIPAGFWHQVTSRGWNKAINLWWRIPLTRKLQQPMRQFYIKDLISRVCLQGSCVPHTVTKKEIKEMVIK